MKTIFETDHDYVCDIQAPCFGMLTHEESEVVKAAKTQVLFRKGDNLTKQGAFASYVLFVIEGLAKKYIEGDHSKDFNLQIIKPGDFLGLSNVFGKTLFSYSTTAITECRAFLIEMKAIVDVIKTNPSFSFTIIKRYCEQNADLYNTLQAVTYKQMNGRMADTLLYLDGLKVNYPDIFQLLSRKDISDFAGTSVESTVKLLKTFEKDGLIVLNEKDITVLNRDDLTNISKRG
jgi:CRP/FNR family transcriptional regulator